ncbi:MAG: hypothetical protein LIP12_07875 [Clostridiales bacterium]|nr:hypothetical protein [Clostridiales bacterium]
MKREQRFLRENRWIGRLFFYEYERKRIGSEAQEDLDVAESFFSCHKNR